jgi:hypothetical protein
MGDPDVHVLAAGYVLDALADDERAVFDEHLWSCTVCREELDSLQRAAVALAYAVPAPRVPWALRARLVARARGREARRTYVVPASAGLAVAAAAAAIGLGVWTSTLAGALDRERTARRDDARALAILASPGTVRYALRGARGAVVVTREGDAALVVAGLPEAPSGRSYEVWVVAAGAARPAGTFAGGSSRSLVVLTRAVPARARVAVSIERAGGAAMLSGPTIFGAQTS